MRTGKILVLMVTALVVILTGLVCFAPISAETITIPDGASLIEQARALNGREVIYQGEVIGDIMPRQDHYWINVLGSGTAIGIWITTDQRSAINLAGQYGVRGDEVRITGQFNQACSEHGGDLDIHASSVEIIKMGGQVEQELNIARLAAAAGLFLLAGVSLILLIRRRILWKHPAIK